MIAELVMTAAVHHRPHHVSRTEHRPGLGQVLDVTAYCATGNRNAAGNWPSVGTAAGNAWPLGTRLHVAGIGDVTVEDRSAEGSTDVDLYLGAGPDCSTAAAEFGRQKLLVREAA